VPFEVVGTMQKVGHGNNNGENMRLIMPYTTMETYFPMQGAGNAKAVKYVVYQPISTHHFTRQRIGIYRNPGAGGIGQRHDSRNTRVTSRSY
jgi:hypothetical protein